MLAKKNDLTCKMPTDILQTDHFVIFDQQYLNKSESQL